MDSVRKLLDTPTYIAFTRTARPRILRGQLMGLPPPPQHGRQRITLSRTHI